MRTAVAIAGGRPLRGTGNGRAGPSAPAMAGAIARLPSPVMSTAVPSVITAVPTDTAVHRLVSRNTWFACADVTSPSPNGPDNPRAAGGQLWIRAGRNAGRPSGSFGC